MPPKDASASNTLGYVGVGLATVAVLALRFGGRLAGLLPPVFVDVIFSTVALLATLIALVICLVSLAHDKSKVAALLGLGIIIVGETYRLPLVLINALTLLVIWLPALALVALVTLLAYLLCRWCKPTKPRLPS